MVKFPTRDIDCRAVVPFQVKDLERALKHVKKFDVCVQAGGNVGIWPLYLANKFKEVYTFEPDRENYECLVENIGDTANITHSRQALGDKRDTGSLDGDPRNCGAYQINPDSTEDEFEIIKVDDLELDVDFLCLDIEGYEMKAIKGALATIKRTWPVIMLEDKGLSERYGTEQGDIEDVLLYFGYNLVDTVHRDLIFVKS